MNGHLCWQLGGRHALAKTKICISGMWSHIKKQDAELTVWPHSGVELTEENREAILQFFADEFDIVPTLVGCVETLPDKDEDGINVPNTGGRLDLFFYVNLSDMAKFVFKRFWFGMRWWTDIYFNKGEDIYPLDFRTAFPRVGWTDTRPVERVPR